LEDVMAKKLPEGMSESEVMGLAGGVGEHYSGWTPEQHQYVAMRIDGSTQREAAAAVGISEGTATNWERHRPELRIREAIAAGVALKAGAENPGTGVTNGIISMMASTCKTISSSVINAEVAQYAQKAGLAMKALKTLEDALTEAPRYSDKIKAAEALMRILEVKITVDETMSASQVSNGLSEGGRTEIEQKLLGVVMRQKAWDTMRSAETEVVNEE